MTKTINESTKNVVLLGAVCPCRGECEYIKIDYDNDDNDDNEINQKRSAEKS